MDSGTAELTELERVKMENFALKHNSLQQQLNANLAQRQAYIEQIEAAHPGHRWDEPRGLVKKEEPGRPQPMIPVKRVR
jgi:hypothetical protein